MKRALIGVLAVAACTPGDRPRFRGDGPVVLRMDGGGLPLARVLDVRLDREARLIVEVEDSRGPRTLRFPAEKHHEVPLLGFVPNDEIDLVVVAEDDAGRSLPERVSFTTGGMPASFPLVDV